MTRYGCMVEDRGRLAAENRELRAEVERWKREHDQAIGQRDAAMDDAERLRARDNDANRSLLDPTRRVDR